MAEDIELLQELRGDVKDKRRAALLEAYIKQATPAAIATKALEILAKEIDAIDKP